MIQLFYDFINTKRIYWMDKTDIEILLSSEEGQEGWCRWLIDNGYDPQESFSQSYRRLNEEDRKYIVGKCLYKRY